MPPVVVGNQQISFTWQNAFQNHPNADKCHVYCSGPVFTKGLSQGLGLKLRLLSQVSTQKLLRLLS